MFGKSKKSSADRFVMRKGREAGNFGTSGPGVSKGSKGGGKGKDSPDPFKPRTLKVGRNSGFKD